MNKILVEIVCPATAKTYDFLLPEKMTVKKAIEKIRLEIIDFEQNEDLFSDSDKLMLWEEDKKAVLYREYTLEQSGVYGGNKLYLL